MLEAQYSHDDIRQLALTEHFNSSFAKLYQHRVQFKQFDGTWSPVCERLILSKDRAVAVLLYDRVLDRVVLLEQVRFGAINDAKSPWLFEVVAGLCDTDQSPEATAVREVREETGLAIDRVSPIASFYSTPGSCDEYVHLYYAFVDSQQVRGVHGCANELEDIKLHVVDRETAVQSIQSGTIRNAFTIIALQWLQLHWQDFVKR